MKFKVGDPVRIKYSGNRGVVMQINSINRHIAVEVPGNFNLLTKTGWYYLEEGDLYEDTNPFSIKDVIFNDPAVIVLWNDGSKTVVKCSENDIFDPEKGLAMAISKKALGNQGNYYNTFRKYLSVYEEEEEEEEEYVSNLIAEIWNNTLGAMYKKESK